MVAKIRKCFPAVNSSTSLSVSSGLPFSANTRDFSTSRTLKEIIGKNENRNVHSISWVSTFFIKENLCPYGAVNLMVSYYTLQNDSRNPVFI